MGFYHSLPKNPGDPTLFSQVYTQILFSVLLITEDYRPKELSELILKKDAKRQIISWINQWKAGEATKKALLLFGPPGVGKTTLSLVLAREMGFPLVEINSSEKRNREAIDMVVALGGAYGDLTNIDALDSKKPQKIILVDEADNIFEGQGDTGGITALGKAISKSRNPIIITMNEFYDFRRKQGAQSIIEQSLTIEFKPYSRKRDTDYKEFFSSLRSRMKFIADSEGMEISDLTIDRIVENNGTDIRAMLNDLERMRNVSVKKGYEMEKTRDVEASAYTVIDMSLRGEDPAETYNRLMDTDLDPEDYLLWLDKNASMVAIEPDDLNSSYDLISTADGFIGRIRRKQHYGFMAYASEAGTHICTVISNPNPHYTKYEFPSFIIGLSRAKRVAADRRSLSLKYGRITHSSSVTASKDIWLLKMLKQKRRKEFENLAIRLSFSSGETDVIG